jgi:restriction system protein
MARRKHKSGLEEILAMRWQGQLTLAGIAAVCALVIPALGGRNPVLRPLTEFFASLAWLAALGLAIIALVNFAIHKAKDKDRNLLRPANAERVSSTRRATLPEINIPVTQADAAWSTSIQHVSSIKTSPTKPEKWSVELLRELEWKRFEILCGEYYAKRGFRVETIACGADGGIDAKLFFGEIKEPVGLVQCKAWSSKFVGVNIVRELLGVMAHHKVRKGILHATGRFSTDALDFARANKIQCIDGAELVSNIGTVPQVAQQELLALAVEGDYKTPTCTSCGIKMRRVSTKRGDMWGCPNYPRCKVHWNIAQRVE